MIILIHGTGDDDSKDENWIKWVAELKRAKGESVLVLPGVGSGQQTDLFDRSWAFMDGLLEGGALRNNRGREVMTVPDDLLTSLRTAGASADNEIRPLLSAPAHFHVLGTYQGLMDQVARAQRPEGGTDAIGIKTRAAFAALCGKAYWQSCPADLLQPIRIIGHSRGGSAAIAAHNLLRYFGIKSVETLTLDPCHGVKKVGAKDYTHTVWSGRVTNIPVVKEVGTGSTWFFYTSRPPISIGAGADAGTSVQNLNQLTTIEHGHMGKLTNFKKPGTMDKIRGRSDDMLARKAAAQAALRANINGTLAGGAGVELEDLFAEAQDRRGDLADKQLIHRYVCQLLGSRNYRRARLAVGA